MKPNPRNWRTHPQAQQDALRGLLAEIGYADALLCRELQDGTLELVDGHLRAETTPDEAVPVLVLDVDEAEADKLLLTLDPLAAMAEASQQRLGELLAATSTKNDAVQALLDELAAKNGVDLFEDAAETPDPEPQIDRAMELQEQWGTESGQLWAIPGKAGEHRLLCGDSTKPEDVARVMGGKKINVAFTSPPYASQRKYDESSGFKPIPPDEYVAWWEPIQANIKERMAGDGSFFVNIKPNAEGLDTELYVFDLVCKMARGWEWHFATEFCWERTGVPKGVTRRFKNQFEPVYQFAVGEWKMRPKAVQHESSDVPMSLGKGSGNTGWADKQGTGGVIPSNRRPRRKGKTSTKSLDQMQCTGCDVGEVVVNGMAYPGNRLPPFTGTHEALGHTAAFPVGLPSFFIKAFSDAGDVIFDPFLGSGTTLIACENLGRTGHGIELSPAYCAVILQRMTDAGLEPYKKD